MQRPELQILFIPSPTVSHVSSCLLGMCTHVHALGPRCTNLQVLQHDVQPSRLARHSHERCVEFLVGRHTRPLHEGVDLHRLIKVHTPIDLAGADCLRVDLDGVVAL